MNAKLFFPTKGFNNDNYIPVVPHSKNMLERGVDPKPYLIEFCEPGCVFWKEKLDRCESKLENVIKINPSKTCLPPMRDWITCVDSCVNPKIFNNLKRGRDIHHNYY